MAAPEDLPVHCHDGIKPLPGTQFGPLFDPVKRMFRRPAEDGENGNVAQGGNTIVPPFPGGDHSPIKTKDQAKLAPVKTDLLGHLGGKGKGGRRLDRHPSRLPQAEVKSSAVAV